MSKNEYQVEDRYRTNPLSHEPGGAVVKIHYDTEIKVYDKVKSPKKYLASVAHKINVAGIRKIEVNGEPFWSPGQWDLFTDN